MVFRRVTRADGSVVCARRFSYDAAGRLAGYQDSLRGARRYEYDSADFLTSVTDAGGVQPFQHETGEGLVLVDANRITRQPYNKWQINLPSTNEIWSNQEDIWLLQSILTSIARVNEGATRLTESQGLGELAPRPPHRIPISLPAATPDLGQPTGATHFVQSRVPESPRRALSSIPTFRLASLVPASLQSPSQVVVSGH